MSPKSWHAHTRTHFFKFSTAAVAEKILQTRNLKWSAPDLFNDPFDHRVSLILPFTPEEATLAIFKAQAKLIFGPKEPVIVKRTLLGNLSLTLRMKTYTKDERHFVMQELKAGARESSANLKDMQVKLNSAFQDHLKHSRILCLSETNENVVMWSHYAEEHRGVAFKFRCLEEDDDDLMMARPVQYVEEFPKFVSAQRWAEEALGLDSIDAGRLADSCCYLKHIDWSYEREWRVILPLLPHEPRGDGIHYRQKVPRVFEAMYLGCRMPEDTALRLVDAARKELPEMEIYRASRSSEAFRLKFDKIN